MATNGEITEGISTLYDTINQIIEEARAAVYRTANITMVRAYWHIGRVIVEDEQKGKERAEYGKQVLKQLSQKLTKNMVVALMKVTCATCVTFTSFIQNVTHCVLN